VLDRGILEAQACECYRTMQAEFSRLLPQPARRAQQLARPGL
jgi:hypothetical protein